MKEFSRRNYGTKIRKGGYVGRDVECYKIIIRIKKYIVHAHSHRFDRKGAQ